MKHAAGFVVPMDSDADLSYLPSLRPSRGACLGANISRKDSWHVKPRFRLAVSRRRTRNQKRSLTQRLMAYQTAISFSSNTVQRSITTVFSKGLSSLFLPRCSGLHLPHRDIFRFITRGLIRLRRAGCRSQLISQITASYHSSRL